MRKDSDKSPALNDDRHRTAELTSRAVGLDLQFEDPGSTAHARANSASRRRTDTPAAWAGSDDEKIALLFERRARLDNALVPQDEESLVGLLKRSPPSPVVLLFIEAQPVRERLLSLLHNGHMSVECASHRREALSHLNTKLNAVFLTDQLESIREARQLRSGSLTHIVFVSADADTASAALDLGANEVMPTDTQMAHFWTQLNNVRRIVSFAASLQSAVTDNRILSSMDELTHCGNRRFFEQQFPREVERAWRLGRPLSLILVDIDLFKAINDQYGHPVGDEVLRLFGARLTDGLRLGEDWVARIGGEEFAVILPETSEAQAVAIAERLRGDIAARLFETSAAAIPVTASFGLCEFRGSLRGASARSERIVEEADAALYSSKRAGRNRVTAAIRSEDNTEAG